MVLVDSQHEDLWHALCCAQQFSKRHAHFEGRSITRGHLLKGAQDLLSEGLSSSLQLVAGRKPCAILQLKVLN